jgi:hypothetical protein
MKVVFLNQRLLARAIKGLVVAFCALLLVDNVAQSLVGGARLASGDVARSVVGIVGAHGARARSFCTATAIAQDLLLTAGHCMQQDVNYKVQHGGRDGSRTYSDIVRWERPSQFAALKTGPVADLALLKLAKPLPADIGIATLDLRHAPVWPGDRFIVVGEGITLPGLRETGFNRTANLVAAAPFTDRQIRLVNPSGSSNAEGACAGDSGAPVFQQQSDGTNVVVGVVSWAIGPDHTKGCGGITGATLLTPYRRWIEETTDKLKRYTDDGSRPAPVR